jgi:hypothetical protein
MVSLSRVEWGRENDELEGMQEDGVGAFFRDRVRRTTFSFSVCEWGKGIVRRALYESGRKRREVSIPRGKQRMMSTPPGRTTSPYRLPHLSLHDGGMAQKKVKS